MSLSGVEINTNTTNTITKKNKKKKTTNILDVLEKQKKKEDLSKFDPITGEKIALETNAQHSKTINSPIAKSFQGQQRINKDDFRKLMQRKLLALDEIKAEAKKGKSEPINKWDAIKSGTLGTTAGFLVGNLLDTTARRKGLLSLGMGLGVAALDTKKQMADYNAQMGARETLLGINTPRKKAYLNNVKNKYNI
jgi:hypothetical protein